MRAPLSVAGVVPEPAHKMAEEARGGNGVSEEETGGASRRDGLGRGGRGRREHVMWHRKCPTPAAAAAPAPTPTPTPTPTPAPAPTPTSAAAAAPSGHYEPRSHHL